MTHLTPYPYQKLNIKPTNNRKITLELFQKYQNLDLVIRRLKLWHKNKTKPTKADTTILENKTLLRYFRKLNNTTIKENTDICEYQTPDFKVPCLPLSMMLIPHLTYKMTFKIIKNIF